MSAILDLPEMRARVHRWTVEGYRVLAEDNPEFGHSELIRGIIVEKEMKTPVHNFLTGRVADLFRQAVRAGLIVRQEATLLLPDSAPEPDVAVVRGREEDFRLVHPATASLVVEVAVTSIATDREKASLYAEAGVAEYWILLGEAGQVEVHRSPVSGVYRTRRLYGRGEVIEGIDVTEEPVTVESLFV